MFVVAPVPEAPDDTTDFAFPLAVMVVPLLLTTGPVLVPVAVPVATALPLAFTGSVTLYVPLPLPPPYSPLRVVLAAPFWFRTTPVLPLAVCWLGTGVGVSACALNAKDREATMANTIAEFLKIFMLFLLFKFGC
jgi:hypothetical protein